MIVLGRICYAVYKYAPVHTMRERAFWIHTIFPLLILCVLNIAMLRQGGILQLALWYDNLHLTVIEPLRAAFPIVVSICTTILGLLVVFSILYPSLSIYPYGAYVKDGHKYWLSFLMKNNSLWEIYGLEAYLNVFEENQNNLGHKQISPVKLDLTSTYPILEWKFGHENQNSILIETKNNTINKNKLREKNAQFELLVKVMHPISRITKVYKQHFNLSDIHYGYFKNCRLYRYDPKDKTKHLLSRLLKEKLWEISNVLRQIELFLITAWILLICWYIIVNPHTEYGICVTEWTYAWLSIVIAIIEMARQISKCPTKNIKTNTNL